MGGTLGIRQGGAGIASFAIWPNRSVGGGAQWQMGEGGLGQVSRPRFHEYTKRTIAFLEVVDLEHADELAETKL